MRKTVTSWGVLALMCLFSFAAFAGDVNGKWTYETTTQNGDKRPGALTLKAEGDKLTGTITGRQGAETPISEGKITGDDISFVVVRNFNGEERKIKYTGKLVGNELKLNWMMGPDRNVEVTAKRGTT